MSIAALEAITAKKPRRADALRNYESLIAAARDAFNEHGTDASLEDVARRAGVGIGTLYRNFPTRDELIEAVYINEIEKLAIAADRVADEEPWAALTSWFDSFVEYVGTKYVLIAAMNRDTEVFKNCRMVMYAAGEPVLKRAQDAKIVRPDVTIEDAVRLVAGIAGVSYENDAQRDRILALAIDGLRAR